MYDLKFIIIFYTATTMYLCKLDSLYCKKLTLPYVFTRPFTCKPILGIKINSFVYIIGLVTKPLIFL